MIQSKNIILSIIIICNLNSSISMNILAPNYQKFPTSNSIDIQHNQDNQEIPHQLKLKISKAIDRASEISHLETLKNKLEEISLKYPENNWINQALKVVENLKKNHKKLIPKKSNAPQLTEESFEEYIENI